MIEYLAVGITDYRVVNKINECARALNSMEAGQTPVQHGQVAICTACGNRIRADKPVATGAHCILCGGTVPHNKRSQHVVRKTVFSGGYINKILCLIKGEVCMGTYGLVELELRKLVELLDEMELFAKECDRAGNGRDARQVRSWVKQLRAGA